jgi:hypothetical protein
MTRFLEGFQMEVSEKVLKFYNQSGPLVKELGNWIESEEDRLQRELSEDEIDSKFKELQSKKYNLNYQS